MQSWNAAFFLFFLLAIRWGGGDFGSGSGSKFNRAARVGSGWVRQSRVRAGFGLQFWAVQTSTLDSPWVSCHQSAIVFNAGAGIDENLLSDWDVFVVWCNNEHSSRHLLPTSELLKTQWVPLFLKGMHPPIYLNAFMFARIIRDPASAREEVSIKLFYESLQIAFPNNVLVSKFHS